VWKRWRKGAHMTVTYVEEPVSAEDMERRGEDLKWLIIKAAILRATKLRTAKLPRTTD
jgi:hypothetical protein